MTRGTFVGENQKTAKCSFKKKKHSCHKNVPFISSEKSKKKGTEFLRMYFYVYGRTGKKALFQNKKNVDRTVPKKQNFFFPHKQLSCVPIFTFTCQCLRPPVYGEVFALSTSFCFIIIIIEVTTQRLRFILINVSLFLCGVESCS